MRDAAALAKQVSRVGVTIGRACDGACVFCAQEGLPRETWGDGEVDARLQAARAAGARAVTLVGGEPAIDARIESLVRRARSLGFARVGIQSNGVALSRGGRLDALARAGLTDVHLSIHGAEARVHDYHAGREGAFEAACATFAASRAAGLDVVVSTVLTRSNFRVLGSMPRLLASRGAAAWCIQVARWRGRAAAGADRVVPRLALALPFALHAMESAAALGLPAFVRGAPSCLLGPFAARALLLLLLLDRIASDAGAAGAYGQSCASCSARSSCAGVDAEYLARFGEEEIAPCAPATPAADDARDDDLRAMFVGVGETAPPPARAAERHVALPVLGRPVPARAEVPASAPKRSGDALREILPALFVDAPGIACVDDAPGIAHVDDASGIAHERDGEP